MGSKETEPTPVVPDGVASNGHLSIVLPDGKLLSQFSQIFENEAAAKASILREAQEQWDAKERRKAQASA
jgi:hypothetical protein